MKIIGHRGARGEAPENTRAAFQLAADLRLDGIELDLQLSADNELVIIHDETVDRTTSQSGQVSQLSSAELSQFDARRNAPPCEHRQPVLTLEQFFLEFSSFGSIQLEVKPANDATRSIICDRLIELVERHECWQSVTATSFDRDTLRQLKQKSPRLETGLVTDTRDPDPVTTAIELGAGLLALGQHLATKARIQRAQQEGLEVSVWTVNGKKKTESLARYGADSVITDYPSRVRNWLS